MNLIEKLLYKIERPMPVVESVPLLDKSVVKVITQLPFNDSFNTVTPFEEYNRVLNFSGGFSIFGSNDLNDGFHKIWGKLLVKEDAGDGYFNFRDLDSLANSKSAFSWYSNPINKWRDMNAFGKYAYLEHLPNSHCGVGDLDSDEKIKNHDDRLRKIFDDAARSNQAFSSVTHKLWCNRYVLNNSGRSRRYAAISHLARSDKEAFNQDINVKFMTETLNRNSINDLDEMSDNYVFFTTKRYFEGLQSAIPIHEVPIGFYQSKWSDTDYRANCIFMLSILKEQSIEQLFSKNYRSYNLEKYKQQYLDSREVIKPQLDKLLEEEFVLTLSDLIDVVIEKSTRKE